MRLRRFDGKGALGVAKQPHAVRARDAKTRKNARGVPAAPGRRRRTVERPDLERRRRRIQAVKDRPRGPSAIEHTPPSDSVAGSGDAPERVCDRGRKGRIQGREGRDYTGREDTVSGDAGRAPGALTETIAGFFDPAVEEEARRKLRRASSSGRPLGAADWVNALEAATGRALAEPPIDRPRRAVMAAEVDGSLV